MQTPAIIDAGRWTKGATRGQGVVVVTPAYVGFLHTEKRLNLVAEFARQVAHAVLTGDLDLDGGERPKIPEIIHALATGRVDEQFGLLSERFDGRTWRPDEASLRVRPLRLHEGQYVMVFCKGRQKIRILRAFGGPDLAALDSVLAGWRVTQP
jgi:hypothetical protein